MIKPKRAGRRSKRPSKSELEMQYELMTAAEIAKKYEVAESTVRAWIRDYRREEQKKNVGAG